MLAAFPPLMLGLIQVLLSGRPVGAASGVVLQRDSIQVVRTARAAQLAFEYFRRGLLPRTKGGGGAGGGSGSCDAQIGRYCYWRGNDDDEAPPPEPPSVQQRRRELIDLLDDASSALPGDGWLAGQEVRYLVEAGRTDDALTVARSCRAEASWCAALAGYAAHVGGRFDVADSAFRVALAAMDAPTRCRWLDVSALLDGELADRFKTISCADREAFVRRVFRLGSPLFSVSDRDLLTEYFARMTRARIAEQAATPDGEVWADDARELTIRYGWPRWYSRGVPRFESDMPSITGHDAGLPYDFLPRLHAIEHLGSVTADDWRLDDAHAATEYAPAFARTMHDLPSQVAAFRRGDSTLVVAAWDARRDTTLAGQDLDAALVLVGVDGIRAMRRAQHAPPFSRLSVTTLLDSGMASVELLAPAQRRAARAHVALPGRRPGQMALSDLLLYDPTDAPSDDLAAARDSALASNTVPPSGQIGVYWEAYGLPGGEPVHYTLTVDQIAIGWVQRAKVRLHLDDPASSLRVQWDEVPRQRDGIAGRGVRLDVSRLRPGTYQMEVSVVGKGEAPLIAARQIVIR